LLASLIEFSPLVIKAMHPPLMRTRARCTAYSQFK
jgi:hypothetical protein